MPQSKDTEYQNGFFLKKAHQYAVYKKLILDPKTPPDFKVRGWKTIYHANGHQKKTGVAILISDKLDFKPKTIIRDEELHYIILKMSIQKEELTILSISAPT